MANYLTYPLKTMRITQSYTGAFSHLPHTTGSPKDYPIDDGGKDGGKDAIYCPCDSVKVFRVYGVGNKGTKEAGAAAGADMIAIETMSDLTETRAALIAAKEATALPAIISIFPRAKAR